MTNLLHQLRNNATRDLPARNAALEATEAMVKGATRAGALLRQAQAVAQQAAVDPVIKLQRTSILAEQAYRERTNAEVAKYRALFAMQAETEGNSMASWDSVARQTVDKRTKAGAVERSRYHGKRRSLMMAAANATAAALKSVPPLPMVGPQVAPDYDMYRPVEMAVTPANGWRPRVFSELAGNFFPADIRRAAGGLQGVTQLPLGETSVWDSFKTAISTGVVATGRSALSEGQKAAGQDPAGGLIIGTGGGLLDSLSRLLGVAEQKGASAAPTPAGTGFPWTVVAIGGAALVGGFLIYKAVKS